MNQALRQAIEESGQHPSDLVRGITTTRTLDRWLNGQKPKDPFKSRQLARRLKRSHEELFGG